MLSVGARVTENDSPVPAAIGAAEQLADVAAEASIVQRVVVPCLKVRVPATLGVAEKLAPVP